MLHNVIYMQNLRIDLEYRHEYQIAKKRNLVPTPSLSERIDRPHLQTCLNAFKRIQTHSNGLIIFICMMKSH